MPLLTDQLAFIVRFIGACRDADSDAALEILLTDLRENVDFSSLWLGRCAPAGVTTVASFVGGIPRQAIEGCAPKRNADPEPVGDAIRACLATPDGRSTCLVLDKALSSGAHEILTHVAPHLLEAVARVVPWHREAVQPLLTAREEEVLQWLVQGKSNDVIAQILDVTPRTVKFHLANLYAKLGVTTRAQAAAIAVARLMV
jgi:DNA-binding CsgD family transcriptional regulator